MNNQAEFKFKKYDISDFDEKMNLKLGANNLLAISFLCHPLFIEIVASTLKGSTANNFLKSTYYNHDLMIWAFAAVMPVLIWVCSFLMSNPFTEKLKEKGKLLFVVTGLCNIAIWSLILFFARYKTDLFQVFMCFASICCLIYILKSKRLDDYFTSIKGQQSQSGN